jgi:hypothetical protein
VVLSLIVAAAVMAEPVVVVDGSLKTTVGELVSLRERTAVMNVAGKEVTVTGAAALVAAASWRPERQWPGLPNGEAAEDVSSKTMVVLTDGSRLRGDLLAGKGDSLVLAHKLLGKVEFPLDSLRLLTMGGAVEGGGGTRSGKSDSVRLLNGDRIEGFIESIGPAKKEGEGDKGGLAVTVERDKTKTAVPLDRVASVSLQGGGVKKAAKTVWLAGGEKTGAAEVSVEKGEARLVRVKGSPAVSIKPAEIEGVVIEPGVLTPLAGCAVRGSVETGPEQTLGTRDLTIPEPGRVSWELPKGGGGARRISGWAVLPEECRTWGDCTVTVAVGVDAGAGSAQKVVEFALSGAAPVVKIDQELPAATTGAWLIVTVGEGKNGPVQDQVVLRRVLIGMGGGAESK